MNIFARCAVPGHKKALQSLSPESRIQCSVHFLTQYLHASVPNNNEQSSFSKYPLYGGDSQWRQSLNSANHSGLKYWCWIANLHASFRTISGATQNRLRRFSRGVDSLLLLNVLPSTIPSIWDWLKDNGNRIQASDPQVNFQIAVIFKGDEPIQRQTATDLQAPRIQPTIMWEWALREF
jgi:hypothetical protein